jgi:formate dehydrogenase iron-sulfur subunit
MIVSEAHSTKTFIDLLLEEQRRPGTAVAKFSRWHDEDLLLERRETYRDLIPLSRPGPGEQYAFEVNLDACSGCKACVAACHSLNGLDEHETWRSVGHLHHAGNERAHHQTITTACHHCAEPACSDGCPVLAYEKDEDTGIVRHLDDQCIGCQYCSLKCPYDVPKYNDRLGIVRKCDMCHSRLAVGEAPACVQSCPTQAIRIVTVSRPEIAVASIVPLIPGAFDSSYTQPSTRYVTRRADVSSLQPADLSSLRVEAAHAPLVIMLVLTQAAAGIFLFHFLLLLGHMPMPVLLPVTGVVFALAGLAASILHLGRPLQAWRAFLGWRKSWLSREILGFGFWMPLALATAAFSAFPPLARNLNPTLPLSLLTALVGLAAVACSAMVYADTQRAFWSGLRSFGKFFGTTLLLGAAFAAAWTRDPFWSWTALALLVAKSGGEAADLFFHLKKEDLSSPNAKSARVMSKLLAPWTAGRFAAAAAGALLLGIEPTAAAACLLLGELLERLLFFRAVTAPRMPGMPV